MPINKDHVSLWEIGYADALRSSSTSRTYDPKEVIPSISLSVRFNVPVELAQKHLWAWLSKKRPGWKVEVEQRPKGSQGFTPVRKRWVVERSNAWHGRYRRNSKDYERRSDSSAAMIQISRAQVMLRQLKPNQQTEFKYRNTAGKSGKIS